MNLQHALRETAKAFDSSIVPRLCEYIRIPNKSPLFDPEWQAHGHMDRAAELMAAWCREQPVAGLRVEIIRAANRTPVLLCEMPGTGPGTVLLYGHMDKQPEFTGWAEGLSPWEPCCATASLWTRGAMTAMRFFLADGGRLLQQQESPRRCVILIEACERQQLRPAPLCRGARRSHWHARSGRVLDASRQLRRLSARPVARQQPARCRSRY
jgi:acetylornithine deacetylase/succinyl-diaminopimelate desuccinylase-like protein